MRIIKKEAAISQKCCEALREVSEAALITYRGHCLRPVLLQESLEIKNVCIKCFGVQFFGSILHTCHDK